MCKGSGGSTNTVTTSQQPFPAAVNAYTNANNWANYAANLGAQTYGGQLVATNPMLPGAAANTLNLSQDFVPFRDPALANLQAVPGYGTTAAGYGQTAADLASRYGGNAAANADWYAGQAYNYGGQAPGIAAGAGDAANTAAARGTDWANYGASAASNAGGTAEDFARSYGNQAAGYGGTGMGIAGGYGNQATAAAATAPGIAAGYGNQALTSAQGGMSAATGYGNAATRAAGSAPGLINTYLSPYTQNVVDATQAQFNNQNAIQNAGVVGNAAAQGAWGGDRSAVAQGIVAGQQQTAQAPVIAGLYQQGYQQAVQAAQQQAQLQAQTGVQAGQLGIAGAGLGATTALGAGQEGIAGAQLGAQTGIQAGQLGLAGTQQAAQAAEAAGQLGLGATGQQIQAGIQGGQLGVGAAGQRATTALGAGQLGIAGQQQATQAALGAAQQSTAANLGAGQLANQANLGAGQLNLGAGELNTAAAAGLGNLGQQNYNIDLGTLNAQIAAGGLEQQQQQAQLNVPYQQWLSAQAYPYQTAQFLANIAEGTGGLSGGTATTTSPAASGLSQALGLGIGGAGLIGATGGFGANGWLTNLVGGGGSATGFIPGTSEALNTGAPGYSWNWARGGAIPHRQMGGIIPGGMAPGQPGPIGTGIPDVSMSVIPLGGGSRTPTILNPMASTGQTSTSSGGGGGGSSIVGDLGTAASLAKLGLMIFDRGGGVPHRQFGGSAPSYGIAPNPGNISPSFMPPDVSVSIFPQQQQQRMMGSGPPRPPAPASGAASQGITPASAMQMLSGLKSVRDLSANGGIFGSSDSSMRRGGGIVGYDEGGDVLDIHDVAGGSRSWADIAGAPGSPSGPAQFPSYQWYERAPDRRSTVSPDIGPWPQVADAGAPDDRVTPPTTPAKDPEVKARDQVASDMGIVPSAIPSTSPSPSDYAGQPYRPDPWMALAAAGFGAAAGRSPQAMQNLGAGALEGLKFYEQERQVAPRLNLEQAQLGVIPSAIRLREAEAGKAESESELYRINVARMKAQLDYDMRNPLSQQLIGNVTQAQQDHKNEGAVPEGPLQEATAQAATANGFDPQFALAHIKSESNFDPGSIGPDRDGHGRPQPNPLGIAQLDRETAARWGVQNPMDPQQALAGYGRYFGTLLQQTGGDYEKAAQLYGTIPQDPARDDKNQATLRAAARAANARAQGTPGVQVAQAGPGSFSDAGRGMAPSPAVAGMAPFDPKFGDRSTYDLFQQQYRQLQQGMQMTQALIARTLQLPGLLPEERTQRIAQLNQQLQQQQSALIQKQESDPWIKGPAAIGQAGGIAAAQAPYSRGYAPRIEMQTDDQGNKIPYWVTPPIPGSKQPPQPPIPALGGVSELGPGTHAALVKRADAEQAQREETLKESESARYQQATLQRMKDASDNMYQGPFSQYVQDASRVLRLIDPSFTKQVANTEDFQKNAGALTRQATHDVSPRAAFQEVQFIQSTLPSPEMSPAGLRSVLNEYMGLNDYRQAKAKAQLDWEMQHGGLGNVQGFEANWQGNAPVTPYTFILSRMEPQERQALIAKWQKTAEGRAEIQRVTAQRQYAISNGLIQ